jgi:hypothetical protein
MSVTAAKVATIERISFPSRIFGLFSACRQPQGSTLIPIARPGTTSSASAANIEVGCPDAYGLTLCGVDVAVHVLRLLAEADLDEVERMAGVGKRRERSRREGGGDCSEQSALGCLAMPHLSPTPQPALNRRRIGLASEWHAPSPGRLPVAVNRHPARAMEQDVIGFVVRQRRQRIGEGREDRRPHAPAIAVLRAKQRRYLLHDVGKHAGCKLTLNPLATTRPMLCARPSSSR